MMGLSRSLPECFAQQVARVPARVALVHQGTCLTYRELAHHAAHLAQRLLRHGVRPEQLVGLSIAPSLDMVVAMLGILEAGGVCVPLDPGYPAERLELLLEDSGVALIVTTRAEAERFVGQAATLICLDEPASDPLILAAPHPLSDPDPAHLAVCLYTSGSTGRPKGVLIEHRALVDHCLAMQSLYGYGVEDRGLLFASLNYVAALEQVFMPLLCGAALVIREPELWTTATFATKVREYGITVADLPPAYLHALLDGWRETDGRPVDWPLRLLIVGGEELRAQTVELWRHSPLRATRLLNAYGMTETPVTVALFEVPADGPLERTPIGRTTPHWTVCVLDEEQRRVGPGVVGEIAVGGSGLARGYLNQPALTAERFIAAPVAGGRLYRTGDLGRLRPDGILEYLGREDQQVQIRGFRVEPGEVEAALAGHPQIAQAAVVARGEGTARHLVAYAVPRGRAVGVPARFGEQLREYLKTKLPAHMVPDRVVLLEQLPTTPNGKVDRQALLADGRPRHGHFRVQLSDYGGLDHLALVACEPPPLAPDEIAIEIRAASLNFRDVLNALGMLRDYNATHLGIERASDMRFGYECAGSVTAVGSAVADLRVGDAVIAYTLGSLASSVVVSRRYVVPKPPSLSFAEAASVPTVFLTALYGLQELARLRPTDRVLVHAAAGRVGLAALQVARRIGAEIYATASPGKWDCVRAQGAARIMNSRTLEFAAEIKAAGGVDVVLNSLNGDFIDQSLAVLNQGGRFIELGKLGIWSPEQVARHRTDVTYHAFDLGDVIDESPALVADLMAQIADGFANGQFQPLPITLFPVEQVVAAFRYLAQARHIGKVVLSFADGAGTLPVIAEPDVAPERPIVLPRTATERAISELWKRVLGSDQCDIRSSFFESGGNSLLALELTACLSSAFAVPIPMQTILEQDTVERLARQIDLWTAAAAGEDEYEEGVL